MRSELPTRLLVGLALLLGGPAGCGEEPSRPSASFPPSPVLEAVRFDLDSVRERAPGSDNWAITWADDDHQYTTWGDGGGFGGTNRKGRVSMGVARVKGGAEAYRGENVWGGYEAPHDATFEGKSYGIVSVDGALYLWRTGDASEDSAFRLQELYVSRDHGASWTFTGVDFERSDFPDSPGFFAPTFLQFGRDYAGSRDGFVYAYAPEARGDEWDVQLPGAVALLRAPRARLAEPDAWEHFAGLEDGEPVWTRRLEGREPVFSDERNGVMRTSVSYDPRLERYLLITQQVSRFRDGGGRIGIYDAPEPWGPWSTVLFADPWELGLQTGEKTVFWNLSSKWRSPEGTGFVLVYTGPGSDGWGSVEGRFLLSEPDAAESE